MKILVSALFIESDSSYSNGGSGKFMTHLIHGLKLLGHEVSAVPHTQLEAHRNEIYDLVILSHIEVIKKVIRANIQGTKIQICQGIIPPPEQPSGLVDKYVSISEEVSNHLKSKGFESSIIYQPYIIEPIEISMNKTLPLKVLHIKGNSTKGSFTHLSNEIYSITESDQSKPIKDQIRNSDIVLAVGRGVLDALSCGKPVIVGDCRSYIGAYGDGLLTEEIFDESLIYNFNGKRYKNSVTKKWFDNQIGKYLKMNLKDMESVMNKFKIFDCEKIAREIVESV